MFELAQVRQTSQGQGQILLLAFFEVSRARLSRSRVVWNSFGHWSLYTSLPGTLEGVCPATTSGHTPESSTREAPPIYRHFVSCFQAPPLRSGWTVGVCTLFPRGLLSAPEGVSPCVFSVQGGTPSALGRRCLGGWPQPWGGHSSGALAQPCRGQATPGTPAQVREGLSGVILPTQVRGHSRWGPWQARGPSASWCLSQP